MWRVKIETRFKTSNLNRQKNSRCQTRKADSPRLHLVAHSVDLLDVGEDHLGIDTLVADHALHVVGSEEVGDASITPGKKRKPVDGRNQTFFQSSSD